MAARSKKDALKLTDLPPDILYNIFPYLSLRNFVNLTTCTRAFFGYRQDPAFWSELVRKTFRVPPQPLLEGKRWQWLYKKLLTQTKLYTWGDNKSGNLGHAKFIDQPGYEHLRPYPHKQSASLPRQPWVDIYVGIISDVQCGGWCTTLLNKDGNIFIMGILNGMRQHFNSERGYHLRQLVFPPEWYPSSNVSYWPETAIKQYSTGRVQVLGLSDDGKVWEWRGPSDMATMIRPFGLKGYDHKVLEVQAGWDRSAMLVRDVGIMYWALEYESHMLIGGRQQAIPTGHHITVAPVTIPGTSFQLKNSKLFADDSLEAKIGEVKYFVVLEAHIVFTTHSNKVFSYATRYPMHAADRPDPVELTTFYYDATSDTTHDEESRPEIRALIGSFTNFAIFTSKGAILTATRSYLDDFHWVSSAGDSAHRTLPTPDLLPQLQTGDITSLSFGDHHMHALHADGSISSLGTECQSCGALGLGDPGVSPYRGVLPVQNAWYRDGYLPKDGTGGRRTIWFEPLMDYWLKKTVWNTHEISAQQSMDSNPTRRSDPIQYPENRKRFGDHFEREGKKWMKDPATSPAQLDPSDSSSSTQNTIPLQPAPGSAKQRAQHLPLDLNKANPDTNPDANTHDTPEDDLPPFFALKIASAGWHSAALVLVDEDKAQRARDQFLLPPPPQPPSPKAEPTGMWSTMMGLGRRFLGLPRPGERRGSAEVSGDRYVFDGDVLPEF